MYKLFLLLSIPLVSYCFIWQKIAPDTYKVTVRVQEPTCLKGCEVTDEIRLTFEEPFNGPPPAETELICKYDTTIVSNNVIYRYFTGVVQYLDSVGLDSAEQLILLDPYDCNGNLNGPQVEYEIQAYKFASLQCP